MRWTVALSLIIYSFAKPALAVLPSVSNKTASHTPDVSLWVRDARVQKIPLEITVKGQSLSCQDMITRIKRGAAILGVFDQGGVQNSKRASKLMLTLKRKGFKAIFKHIGRELIKTNHTPCTNAAGIALLNEMYEKISGVKNFFYTKVAFVGEFGRGSTKTQHLYLMNLDGSQLEKVAPNSTFVFFPKFSFSGRYLSFINMRPIQREGARYELWVLDLKTRKLSKVFSRKGVGLGSAAFHPDNERILIVSMRRHRSRGLYQVSMDRPNRAVPLKYRMGFDVEPHINQGFIVFSSLRTRQPNIFKMPLEALDRKTVPEQLTYVGTYNSTPSIQKEGKWIVFAGARKKTKNAEAQFDLFKIDPSGMVLAPLTQTPWNEESPCFAPHSNDHVLFTRRPIYGGKTSLHVMDVHFPGESTQLWLPVPKGVTIRMSSWSGVLPKNMFQFDQPKGVAHDSKKRKATKLRNASQKSRGTSRKVKRGKRVS